MMKKCNCGWLEWKNKIPGQCQSIVKTPGGIYEPGHNSRTIEERQRRRIEGLDKKFVAMTHTPSAERKKYKTEKERGVFEAASKRWKTNNPTKKPKNRKKASERMTKYNLNRSPQELAKALEKAIITKRESGVFDKWFKQMRKFGTEPERRVKDILIKEGIKFVAQCKLGGKFFDFYLPELKCLVEVDGVYYHGKNKEDWELDHIQEKVRFSDYLRDELAYVSGLKLIRIWQYEENKILQFLEVLS